MVSGKRFGLGKVFEVELESVKELLLEVGILEATGVSKGHDI